MPLGKIIFWFEELPSTMDMAHDLAMKGYPEGTLIIANRQTMGRGRYNRVWISRDGGLWLSSILRPRDNVFINLLPLIFAVSVHETLSIYVSDCWIKWPNDVLVDDKKIAGILSESRFTGSKLSYIVVGIGINLNNAIDDSLEDRAISLSTLLGRKINIPSIFRSLLENMNRFYGIYQLTPSLIIHEFYKRTRMIKKTVKVIMDGKIIQGIGLGINLNGDLILKNQDQIRIIHSYDAPFKVLVEDS